MFALLRVTGRVHSAHVHVRARAVAALPAASRCSLPPPLTHSHCACMYGTVRDGVVALSLCAFLQSVGHWLLSFPGCANGQGSQRSSGAAAQRRSGAAAGRACCRSLLLLLLLTMMCHDCESSHARENFQGNYADFPTSRSTIVDVVTFTMCTWIWEYIVKSTVK